MNGLLGDPMKTYFVMIVLALSATGAIGQTLDKQLATCAATVSNLERLDCYDQLARSNKMNTPQSKQTPTDGVGKWRVNDSKNPIDDTRTVLVVLASETGKPRFGGEIRLVLRCKSKETEAYINWSDFLGTDKASVTTRIGNQKATTSDWGLSSDNKASFYPGDVVSFIKSLMEHDSFIAQVTPFSESPLTASFDTKNLVNAVKPLRETCGW